MKLTQVKLWLVTIATVIAALTSAIDAINGDGATKKQVEAVVDEATAPTPVPTIALGGPGDDTIPQPPASVAIPAIAGVADHADSRDESPDALTNAQIEKNRQTLEDKAKEDQFPTVAPDAAPSWPGCTSRFVRNYSSRGGVKPTKLVAHITVSHNVPGWNDVWSIVNFFNSSASQASSHFVIDGEGHCAYIVRTGDKAWTNATGNPISVQIEFIAYGNEGRLTAAQYKRGGEVFARAGKLYGIPLRRGTVVGCFGGLSGIVEHRDGGSCWGGHSDIRASSGIPLSPLVTAAQNAGKSQRHKIGTHDRARCKSIAAYRDRRRRHLKPTKKGTARFKAQQKANGRLRLKCVNGKPKYK